MGDEKCRKCLKGNYMHTKCNSTQDTVCRTCPENTFIDEDNTMTQCRVCRECSSSSNLVMKEKCKPDKNTLCKCKPGYYCKHPSDPDNSHCDLCALVKKCPPGTGVIIQHTDTRNTECKPCLEGTYSDVDDYLSSCKNHTSCDDLGRHVKSPGTNKSDVQCGDFKCNTSCSWMLPASLWTGFMVTVLVVFLVLFIIYWRNKRRSKTLVCLAEGAVTWKTKEISLSTISPVIPPDILKYPADCDVEKCHEHHKCLTHIDNYPDMDSCIQSDGVKPLMTMSEKYSHSTAAIGHTDSILHHSVMCQSEPQESEWNG